MGHSQKTWNYLPETNTKQSEKQWLEDGISFWGDLYLFQGPDRTFSLDHPLFGGSFPSKSWPFHPIWLCGLNTQRSKTASYISPATWLTMTLVGIAKYVQSLLSPTHLFGQLHMTRFRQLNDRPEFLIFFWVSIEKRMYVREYRVYINRQIVSFTLW